MNAFAVSQFHNSFSLKSEQEQRQKFLNATERVKEVQNIYRPHRKYKRKDVGSEDEHTRIRVTLLEYGNKGKDILPQHLKTDAGLKLTTNATTKTTDDNLHEVQLPDMVCICSFFVCFMMEQYWMCVSIDKWSKNKTTN